MAKRDYYNVLGVTRSATPDQIRTAYRKLARKYHPDVNKDDPKAEDKFKEVQEAYDVLSDKQKRENYDLGGFAGVSGAGQSGGPGGWRPGPGPGQPGGNYRRTYTPTGGPGGFEGFDVGDLGDLFEMFRGGHGPGAGGAGSAGSRGRGRAQPAARGQDLFHDVDISFQEAGLGTKRDIQLVTPTGQQELTVKIPAGIKDGGRIRLAGKGQPGPGGSGDLYLAVHVQPHAYFRREGLDVLVDVPVTLGEAALGAKVEVPTLTGKITLTLPANTSGGGRLRVRGQGIRREKPEEQGDLYVVVRIVLPKTLDDESKRLVREFEERNKFDPRADLGW